MKHLIILFLIHFTAFAAVNAQQNELQGKILQEEAGEKTPLPGANVYWANSTHGTITNDKGEFTLTLHNIKLPAKLVITFIGFENDTVTVRNINYLTHTMKNSTVDMDEVVVEQKQRSSRISTLQPMNVEVISSRELLKSACCNISESFETNPTIDVSYADAVSGAKEIRMLGLAGSYSQMLRENIPIFYGLDAAYGLLYIPGPWLESIHLTKGAGSVVNGYQSTTGQINMELKKPEESELFYLNVFGSMAGRAEVNMNASTAVGKDWHTIILGHANGIFLKNDWNDDGFLDVPLNRQLNLMNRWKYQGTKYRGQFGAHVIRETRQGGQLAFEPSEDKGGTKHYGFGSDVERYEAFAKVGRVWHNKPYKSLGLQTNLLKYHQESYYGLRTYNGQQQSAYANLIYQSIIGTTNHKFKTGVSFEGNDFNERLNDTTLTMQELVPGMFWESSITPFDSFEVIAGVRADYHNLFGVFVTPRLHLKYNFNPRTVIRASAGRGVRVARVPAENQGMLVSSREIVFEEALNPEIAWNYGVNFTRNFKFKAREGYFAVDLYRTDFENRAVVNMDRNPGAAYIYNLRGISYSNTFQFEAGYEPVDRLELKGAYKFYDVRTTLDGELRHQPLMAKHRVLGVIGYATKFEKWVFDLTTQWFGPQRLPDTHLKPEQYQLPGWSPSYTVVNAQITRNFKKWNIYLGGENLTNYMQENPIIASEDPFGEHFDASILYAPIMGTMVYGGIRYTVK